MLEEAMSKFPMRCISTLLSCISYDKNWIYNFNDILKHFYGVLKDVIRPSLDFDVHLTSLTILCASWS